MESEQPIRVARKMIERHGVRAAAVAQERALEAGLAGNTADLDLWESVRLAIAEMHRTAPRAAEPSTGERRSA